MTAAAWPWAAAVVLALLVPWVAGVAGVAYAPFWVLAALPGVPLGLRLTGRHPAGWVIGLGLGYTASCLGVWALAAAGAMSAASLAAAWLLEAVLLLALARGAAGSAVDLPPWSAQDTRALAATLLLVPLLMAAPYRNLGAADEAGARRYRAYFTADFVWHAALTHELGRFEMPPRNPYMQREDLHYYWTYFLVPAAVTSVGPAPVRDVEAALKVNAVATASLLVASLFLLAWSAGAGAVPAALAVALVVLAASAEGAIAIKDLLARGAPLDALRDMNVDAMTAWKYNGLRIDGVHRTMLYTPQHGLSAALGLLALTTAMAAGAGARLSAIALAGVLLGLATALNPFLGAAFSAIYGLAILADAVRTRTAVRQVLQHAAAAVPPALAVAWGAANSMAEGAGAALTIGWTGHARNAPVVTLLMSLGPVLVPALAGLRPSRHLPAAPALFAAAGLLVGLGLLYFVVLSEASWVGFRAGQILLAVITVPLARLLGLLLRARARALAAAVVSGILLIGTPTVIADTRNAADIANLRRGPGFPWTLTVSPGQQQALAWVRTRTAPDAVVQMDVLARGRAHWSFIPTFAGRRMAAGMPISLLPRPEYRDAAQKVRSIYAAADPAAAHQAARRLRIDYLWVDGLDRATYPDGTRALAGAPGYFAPAFDNGEVQVYRVK